MIESKDCPLCQMHGQSSYIAQGSRFAVTCPRCGNFEISEGLYAVFIDADERARLGRLLPSLSAHLRQASERGETKEVTSENWQSLVEIHAHRPIAAKADALLSYVAARTALGQWCEVKLEMDAPLFDAADAQQARYLLTHLEELKLIESGGMPEPVDPMVRLTVRGWDAVQPTGGKGKPGTVFVAMWFDTRLDSAYEAMVHSIEEDCGLVAVRIDRVQHNDQITDRILAAIRSSEFLVADVTGQRQGVYFEAGYAMALGRTVIWSCRKDDLEHVHFDTRQFSHVVWKDEADLRQRLTDRIRGTFLSTRVRTHD